MITREGVVCMSMQALGTLGRGPEDSYLRRGRANAAWPVMGAQRQGKDFDFHLAPSPLICLPGAVLAASSHTPAALEDSVGRDI